MRIASGSPYDTPALSFFAFRGPARGRPCHGLGYHCFKLKRYASSRARVRGHETGQWRVEFRGKDRYLVFKGSEQEARAKYAKAVASLRHGEVELFDGEGRAVEKLKREAS
jgi:hypothetical protein